MADSQSSGNIISYIVVSALALIVVLIVGIVFLKNYDKIVALAKSVTPSAGSVSAGGIASAIPRGAGELVIPDIVLKVGPIVLFGLVIAIFIGLQTYYKTLYRFRATPEDIAMVKGTRRLQLAGTLEVLRPVNLSISRQLGRPGTLVASIDLPKQALLNFRPCCVQNAGYIGGLTEGDPYVDGVFDVDSSTDTGKAIPLSLRAGARAFMFEVDYLDATPCAPVLLYRDGAGYRRSLNTGALQQAMKQLSSLAFQDNWDPVLVILYFRRIPAETDQYTKFFKATALALNALAPYHLSQTDDGNFTRCQNEEQLFRLPMSNFQKKFIVCTNVNTFEYGLPAVPNPKESLHFYTHARIFADINANNQSVLGPITKLPPTNTTPSIIIGSFSDYATMTGANLDAVQQKSQGTFTIALRNPRDALKEQDMRHVLNTCQIQCVPLDVLNLAIRREHIDALEDRNKPVSLATLSNQGISVTDPLAFWRWMGWTPKVVRIENKQGATDYSHWYVIPTPAVPQAQAQQADARGGALRAS
jgi:hypothetical protein